MKTKYLSRMALLLALALVLSYLESLVPLSFAVPGIKMGLPNIVIVWALYRLRFRDAAGLSILRVLLVSLLFGSAFSLLYSLSGAVLSLALMAGLKATKKFGCAGVSVAGAVAHNFGQILMAVLVLETGKLIYYFPVLCISGTVAGICIGLLAALLIKRTDMR